MRNFFGQLLLGSLLSFSLMNPMAMAKTSRELGDLLFTPNKSEFVLTFALEYILSKGDLHLLPSGDTLQAISNKAIHSGFSLRYGLTDSFSIGINNSYAIWEKSESTLGSASARNGEVDKINSEGFADPEIQLSYHLFNKGPHQFSGLLTFFYAPSLISAEDGTTSQDGNNGSGRNIYHLLLELGARKKNHQFAVDLSFTHLGEKKVKKLSNQVIKTTDPHNEYDLGFNYLTTYSPQMASGLRVGLKYTEESLEHEGTTDTRLEGFWLYIVSISGQFRVIPKKLMIELIGFAAFVNDRKIFQGNSVFEFRNNDIATVELSLNYLF